MASQQATIQQMQGVIAALQQSLIDVTQEAVNLRALTTQNRGAIEHLTQTSMQTWGAQAARIDTVENDLNDAQAQIRRGGGGGGGGDREPREWNLLHKGDVDKYAGDRKTYKTWARRVVAFANSKKPGFRKALRWAEQKQAPLATADLAYAQQEWEYTEVANTKLYDLLVQVCTGTP